MSREAKKNYSRWILLRLFPIKHGIISFINLLLFLQLSLYATAQTEAAPPPLPPLPPLQPPPPVNPYSLSPKFSSSMAIIMVAIVSAFFFIGFFSVYIRQCAERRILGSAVPGDEGGGGGRRSRRVARGLDLEVIETFPMFVYSSVKGLKIGKSSLECAVCLNEFKDDETLRLIPKCSHVFHPDCIDAWLVCQTTCPVCRADLVPKPGEIPYVRTQIFDSDSEPEEPERAPNIEDDSQNQTMIRVVDDTRRNVNVLSPNQLLSNQNRPPRSRSTGFRIMEKFRRSHSTGHSLVQPGDNCERFTLRLPEEVRSQIMKSSLNRTKSCVAFPRARSSRRGYRSGSGKNYFNYERFDSEARTDHRWGFSMTPPFISRTNSIRSPKIGADEEVSATPKISLIKSSSKSPFDRLFFRMDDNDNNNSSNNNNDIGERSSDQLRMNDSISMV